MAGISFEQILKKVRADTRKQLADKMAAQKTADKVQTQARSLAAGTGAALRAGHTVMDAAPISSRYKLNGKTLLPGDRGTSKGKESLISSTAVSDMKYNPDNKVMEINFVNGKHPYAYPDVPPQRAVGFEKALSKGRYVLRYIKPFSVPSFRGHA
jgi:hypothetical protein